MKRHFLPLFFSIFCWFGCTGAQPGPGAEETKFKTESAFCAEWAKAACNELVVEFCSGTAPTEETRDACVAKQTSACRVLVPPGYSAENAEDCLEAVRDAYEDAELSAEELAVVLKLEGDCKGLVDGGQSEGGACLTSFDCDGVDGFECVVKAGASLGTCQVPSETSTGGSCRTPESVCGEADYCDPSSGRCISRLAEEPCEFDEACPSDYRCEIAEGETVGACVERLDSGVCSADEDCKSGLCIGTTRKVCVSTVRLSPESSLCETLQ